MPSSSTIASLRMMQSPINLYCLGKRAVASRSPAEYKLFGIHNPRIDHLKFVSSFSRKFHVWWNREWFSCVSLPFSTCPFIKGAWNIFQNVNPTSGKMQSGKHPTLLKNVYNKPASGTHANIFTVSHDTFWSFQHSTCYLSVFLQDKCFSLFFLFFPGCSCQGNSIPVNHSRCHTTEPCGCGPFSTQI